MLLPSKFASTLAIAIALSSTCSGAVDLVVHSSGGNATSPIMYGLMHEDINNSGDGGLYAELIRNRAFQGNQQFLSNLDGWTPLDNATVLSLKQLTTPLSSALPFSLNVAIDSTTATTASSSSTQVGFANDGFWGMDVKRQKYTGSFYARGGYKKGFVFKASLRSALTGEVFGSVDVPSLLSGGDKGGPGGGKDKGKSKGKGKGKEDEEDVGWVQHKFTLVPDRAAPSSNNSFVISFDAAGLPDGSASLDFNLISLFPPTYKNRPNGLRIDLAEALEALNPKFLRLPGGNMLMGNTIDAYWKWNETIGPLKDRPGMAGVWNYQLTTGMGLVEYMEWADDLGAEPIVGVWSGLSLDGAFVPKNEINAVVQDALDEIEFLTGDVSTKWGAVRASLGHPKPWRVKYVEIGNEDWLAGRPAAYDAYKEYRFKAFLDAFTEKHPDIQIIASPSVFDGMTIPAPAAGDYHPYLEPDQFVLREFAKLDQLTEQNLTLIGEAASVHPNGGIKWDGGLMPLPWWLGSVAEAIFLIAAERNSDRIIGATYAPVLRSLDRWQWSMTLIQHAADPALTTKSTSWWVWRLLGNHIITETLPVTAKSGGIGPLYWVAGKGEKKSKIFKAAVYNSTEPVPVSLKFEGKEARKGAKASLTLLTGSEDPYGVNDPFTRANVVNQTKSTLTAGEGGVFEFAMEPLSVAVLETEG